MAFAKDLHVDQALTNVSLKYRNDNYIATDVFPVLPVTKESDKYYVYDRKAFILSETLRQDKSAANEASYGISTTPTYTLAEHALADIVSDRERANADAPVTPDIDATEFLTDSILLRREIEATKLVTTTSFTQYSTLTTTTCFAYLTTTNDIIGLFATATSHVIKQSAKKPNLLELDYASYDNLRNQPNILERIKYSERGIITAEILGAVLDIPKIVIGRAIKNTVAEGGTESMGFIWGVDGTNTNCLLGYVETAAGLRKASTGYTFTTAAGLKTKKWREEKRAGDMIEVSTMFKQEVISPQCGYMFKAANIA